MRITHTPPHGLNLESPIVSLMQTRPVLNGAILESWEAQDARESADGLTFRCSAPALEGGVFYLNVSHDAKGRVWLRYWLEGLPERFVLDSFGLRFEAVENLRSFLRNGYFSWDGSFYVQPDAMDDFEDYEARPEVGYAMTQLLPRSGSGSVVAGFDRHDRFQHTFTVDTRGQVPSLTVLTLWDRKNRTGLARCESERLVAFEHSGVEEALREWAQIVAASAPTPPRVDGLPITGWCSWYNLYGYITEENILEHLRGVNEVVRREGLPMRVFQIDDGFTPEMGDWLEAKPQFPRGMKPLLDDIRAAGFAPGLWIAPFMVGNRSRLYRDHPDWVVRDQETGGPLIQWRLYGEFRWHKRSEEYYILDATHPDAFAYLRHVFRVWRREWGCEYFKTDFMHFGSEHGPDRAVWHTPGMTRIEIWRRVAEMIRQEIGDATWLGCGCPLWASVGLVDAVRIGSDVGVEWRGNLSAQSLLRDLPTRSFANHVLWQIDPDCILLRSHYHYLSDGELQALAIYAGMSGGAMMTSEDMAGLSEERLRLWRLLLNLNERRAACRFPLLGQGEITYERLPADIHSRRVRHEARPSDTVLVQVRDLGPSLACRVQGEPGATVAVFFFNVGDTPAQRTYSLSALGLDSPLRVYDWSAGRWREQAVDSLTVALSAHEGSLLFLGPGA